MADNFPETNNSSKSDNNTDPNQTQSFPVEVAYARPDKQKIITIHVRPGTTALEAAELSGIGFEFPEIDFATAKMGIFGKLLGTKGLKPADQYVLEARDRIEIYRPLLVDPKEVRRQRAEKAKAKKNKSTSD